MCSGHIAKFIDSSFMDNPGHWLQEYQAPKLNQEIRIQFDKRAMAAYSTLTKNWELSFILVDHHVSTYFPYYTARHVYLFLSEKFLTSKFP